MLTISRFPALFLQGPLLSWSFAADTRYLSWAERLALAINLTRTLDFFDQQRCVVCGLNKEQVGIDAEFNVKVLDLDTLAEHLPDGSRLGEGQRCRANDECDKVPVLRNALALEGKPDRSVQSVNDDGSLVMWFKPPRAGSRGTWRHRTCLPRINECRCNATNYCEGFDGSSMLAAALDNMLRPMLDRANYDATWALGRDLERALALLSPTQACGDRWRRQTPGACVLCVGSCFASLALAAAAMATVALVRVAEAHGAFDALRRLQPTRRQRHAELVDEFVAANRRRCAKKAAKKCAS